MQKRIRLIVIPAAYVAGIMLVGAFTGLLVKWLSSPWVIQEAVSGETALWPIDFRNDFWKSILYGVVYTTVLFGTLVISRKLAYRYISIESWKGILTHISIVTITVVSAFLAVTFLDVYFCTVVLGQPDAHDGPPLGIVTVVALGASLIITTVLYSIDFYRGMRHAERTALVSELRALRAQINPHFLFNTLNSIAALVHSRPDEAEYVVEELAELFRYTLRASQYAMVPLAEDLRASERYVAIEKTRFRDRMTVTRHIDQEALDAQIPSLLIQPLLENAVKHGVSKTEDPCAVLINISKEEHDVRIRIRDTGPGFTTTDPGEVFTSGTGLANVRDRLRLHFGLQASFTILPDGVELSFPYRPESEKHPELSPYISSKYL